MGDTLARTWRWRNLIERALEDGAGAAVLVVKELVAELSQLTEDERWYARALLQRTMRNAGLFQAVLDALCEEVILPSRDMLWNALAAALSEDSAAAVMAVAERMEKETPYELSPFVLLDLFSSKLFQDMEVVHAVVDVLPAAAFELHADVDVLCGALRCKIDRLRAVELVLKYGPPMEERLRERDRFYYVNFAIQHCEVEMVRRMYDLVPLLPDGSCRRGEVADFEEAVEHVAKRFVASRQKPCILNGNGGACVFPILDYLAEEGGSEILEEWDAGEVFEAPSMAEVEWVTTRVPHLLEEACKEEDSLFYIMHGFHSDASEYLLEQIAELVDRKVIVDMMHQEALDRSDLWGYAAGGWRWRLETLHKAVPESMDGLRWKWLMSAILDKEDEDYEDVKYMLGMCLPQHLTMRDKDGHTAFDIAAMDEDFPRELLRQLAVMTKGAHA